MISPLISPYEISYLPTVPRPPTLRVPKRANGAESVVIFGVIWRITVTADGLAGINLEVMFSIDKLLFREDIG